MLRAFWHVACYSTHNTHTRFSGITQVSRYQKGKTNLDFTEARDSEWQWHQLDHIQVCTSLQTDNHASTPPLVFHRPDALPAAQPTASKHTTPTKKVNKQFVYYTAKVKKAVSEFWTSKKDKYEPQRLKFVLMIFGTMQIVCMYIEQKI